MNVPVSKVLSEFVVNTKFEDLDVVAIKHARYALLDAIGVSIAAVNLGEGVQGFIDWVKAQESKHACTVFANDFKASPSLAAFANGALAHALDFEDAHDQALVHPNAAVVPASLAVAQSIDASGEELVTAIVVGCEVVCRLGLALKVKLDDFAWYPPPILSAYGATAAVASLLKLNVEQTTTAFSLTLLQATCSAEIKYNPLSDIRAIRDAFPSQTGVVSAQLAQQGIKGFEFPFEGKSGFFEEFARGQYDPELLIKDLGKSFEIAKLSFKRWPSCRGTHTSIELVLGLVEKHKLSPNNIKSITVTGCSVNKMLAEPIDTKRAPKIAIDAKFSIPFCVATAIVGGDVNLESFSSNSLNNSEVLSLARRISYHVDTTIDSLLTSRVSIETNDGQTILAESDSAYGCPERPLSEEDLIAKFVNCLVFSPLKKHQNEAVKFANLILTINELKSLQAIYDFL